MQSKSGLTDLGLADVLATLNYFTAWCIASHIRKLSCPPEIYLSGGGAHNPLLCENLSTILGKKLRTTDSLGLNGDAKEAILFALLANECVAGKPSNFGSEPYKVESAENRPVVSMGKISLPD
jgi:anhydro-N-acetylmuramic acid kinase